jgi:predicted acylesterase/phospholipase RssA
MVGGTSVGAMMGAGMAINRTGAEMEALGRAFASEGITDLTLPMVSFFASASLTRLLRRHTEDVRIEDLARPFFCVSTSLTRSEPVLHTTGPLWKAVRASSAIPGLYAPIVGPDGDLLVDGGIMNNVPVDIMRGFCERGPVIAVNLSIPNDTTVTYDFPASLSGWKVLWSRLNPFARSIKAPSIFTTLLRTTEAGSVHRLRTGEVLRMADLIIQPPLEQMRMLEFRNVEGLMRAGYEAGLLAVNQWAAENPELAAQLRR